MHTDQTLKNEMQMLDDMGMGAIEFLAMEIPVRTQSFTAGARKSGCTIPTRW